MPDSGAVAEWAQILSVPIAVVAIGVSIWLYSRARQRRRIVCEFDPIALPVEVKTGEGLEGSIEIRYRGTPVDNLFLLRVKLRNAGNVPIRRKDVVQPVTFVFDPGTSLMLPPHVADRRPANLTVDLTLPSSDGNDSGIREASMSFGLLNPDDEVVVEFLCTGEPLLPSLTARIEGIKELAIIDPTEAEYRRGAMRAVWFAVVWAGVGVAWTLVGRLPSPLPLLPDSVSTVLAWLSVGALMAVGGAVFLGLLWIEVVRPVLKWVRYRAARGTK